MTIVCCCNFNNQYCIFNKLTLFTSLREASIYRKVYHHYKSVLILNLTLISWRDLINFSIVKLQIISCKYFRIILFQNLKIKICQIFYPRTSSFLINLFFGFFFFSINHLLYWMMYLYWDFKILLKILIYKCLVYFYILPFFFFSLRRVIYFDESRNRRDEIRIFWVSD